MNYRGLKDILNNIYKDTDVKEMNYNSLINYNTIYYMDKKLSNYEDDTKINIKYAMLCSYGEIGEDTKIEKLSIVIGQNPSYSTKTNIDKTNLNILKVINDSDINNIYLMINTFPMICSDGIGAGELLKEESMEIYINKNIKYFNSLIDELGEKLEYELILSFGGNPVCKDFIDNIKEKIGIFKCFCYDDEVVSHMSMQYANLRGRKTSNYRLASCEIKNMNNPFYASIEKKE